MDNIKMLKVIAKELSESDLQFVLCHTDLHGWNLIQTDKLFLLDWEGLKLAPVEADLFSFTEGFFFDYALDTFLNVYRCIHPDYVVHKKAIDFYRIRRRLEDITEFAKGILYDNLPQDEIQTALKHLIKECSLLP